MTSLALLAHTATTADPKFNDTFYATAATVIPVLFLALTIQGRAFQQLTTLKVKATPYLLGAVIGLGIFGEIFAIVALRDNKASAHTADNVFWIVIILTVAVGAAAFISFLVPESSGEPVRGQPAGAVAPADTPETAAGTPSGPAAPAAGDAGTGTGK